jgi:hypothetical protein
MIIFTGPVLNMTTVNSERSENLRAQVRIQFRLYSVVAIRFSLFLKLKMNDVPKSQLAQQRLLILQSQQQQQYHGYLCNASRLKMLPYCSYKLLFLSWQY